MKGIDLARLGSGGGHSDGRDAPFVHPVCPGARIYVTRADLAVMKQGGEYFSEEGTNVPRDGYGHARVQCRRPVEAKVGCSGQVVYYALCSSCTQVESDNRSLLHERQGAK